MGGFSRYFVFLDTSLVMKTGFNFSGGALLNLRKYHDAGIVSVITNQIVVDEVKSNINDKLKEASSLIKNFIGKIYSINELRSSGLYKELFLDFRKENWELFVVSRWEDYLKNVGCIVLQNNNVSVESLLVDYFSGKAPFESRLEKKHEFPDAIIIKSLRNYADINSDTLFIVATEDHGWINALEDSQNITVVKTINSALEIISKEYNPAVFGEIAICIANNQETIIDSIHNYVLDTNIEFINVDLDRDYDEIEELVINSIHIALESVDYAEGDEASITILASINLSVQYSFIDYESSYYDKEESRYLFINNVVMRDDHESELLITLTLVLDESKEKYVVVMIEPDGNLSLCDETCTNSECIESSNANEEPEEWIGEKYYTTCPDCGCKIGHENDGGNGFCSSCASDH